MKTTALSICDRLEKNLALLVSASNEEERENICSDDIDKAYRQADCDIKTIKKVLEMFLTD